MSAKEITDLNALNIDLRDGYKQVDAEEIFLGDQDAIRERFERTDGFVPVIEHGLFAQCLEVARLAVELAKLSRLTHKDAPAKEADAPAKEARKAIEPAYFFKGCRRFNPGQR
jgi:hypothetical protein